MNKTQIGFTGTGKVNTLVPSNGNRFTPAIVDEKELAQREMRIDALNNAYNVLVDENAAYLKLAAKFDSLQFKHKISQKISANLEFMIELQFQVGRLQ